MAVRSHSSVVPGDVLMVCNCNAGLVHADVVVWIDDGSPLIACGDAVVKVVCVEAW